MLDQASIPVYNWYCYGVGKVDFELKFRSRKAALKLYYFAPLRNKIPCSNPS